MVQRASLSAIARELGVIAFFLLLALYATRPLGRDLSGQTLAGPDPLIDLWTVSWLSGHAFAPGQIFQGNIFHPVRHAALLSDLSMGTAVLLVPLRLFFRDPVILYNLGVLGALVFAGWAFSRLTRELGGSFAGGLIAGVVATFGSHQISHVYHLNLLSTGWIPLMLLGLHRIADGRGGAGAIGLVAVGFALSVQSSGYYAVAVAVLLAAFAVSHFRAWRTAKTARYGAAAIGLAALLCLPYVLTFLELRADQGLRRPPGLSEKMAFRPERDITSHTFVYRNLIGDAPGTEHLFPGFLAMGLAAVALARRRPHAGFYAGLIAVMLLMSLGPRVEIAGRSLPLPYAAVFAIPPLDAMRHPYTFAAVAVMLLGVLAGLALPALAGKRAAQRALEAGLVAFAVVEVAAPPLSIRQVPPGVPPVYELLATLPPGPILEIPVQAEGAMLWAARHGLTVVNGDGAFAPTYHAVLERYIQNHWLKRYDIADIDATRPMPFLLQRLAPRYLVLPVGRFRGMDHLVEPMDRSRHFALVGTAADGDRVYERRDPGPGMLSQ